MGHLRQILIVGSAASLLAACSVREKYYEGICKDPDAKAVSGKWELAKEICFVDPKPDSEFTGFLRSIGLIKNIPGSVTSTQLWIKPETYSKKQNTVSINFVQQAVFDSEVIIKPDLGRKINAKVNCETREFREHNGRYRAISRWRKPVLVMAQRGKTKDYSSPLNPYSFIADKYCQNDT